MLTRITRLLGAVRAPARTETPFEPAISAREVPHSLGGMGDRGYHRLYKGVGQPKWRNGEDELGASRALALDLLAPCLSARQMWAHLMT